MLNCKYCEIEKKNKNSLAQHEVRCKDNPDRKKSCFENLDWQISKRKGNQYIKSNQTGIPVVISEETRKKMSDAAKNQKPKTPEVLSRLSKLAKERSLGGVRQSKWITYNGKTLGSTYELELVKDLDRNNILWDICKRFSYIDPNGKHRTYTPDIYLKEFDVYLDPKNDYLINNVNPRLGFTDLEKIKLVEEQNKISVIVLNKNQLKWEYIKTLLKH
jgi:hypothetical protein